MNPNFTQYSIILDTRTVPHKLRFVNYREYTIMFNNDCCLRDGNDFDLWLDRLAEYEENDWLNSYNEFKTAVYGNDNAILAMCDHITYLPINTETIPELNEVSMVQRILSFNGVTLLTELELFDLTGCDLQHFVTRMEQLDNTFWYNPAIDPEIVYPAIGSLNACLFRDRNGMYFCLWDGDDVSLDDFEEMLESCRNDLIDETDEEEIEEGKEFITALEDFIKSCANVTF